MKKSYLFFLGGLSLSIGLPIFINNTNPTTNINTSKDNNSCIINQDTKQTCNANARISSIPITPGMFVQNEAAIQNINDVMYSWELQSLLEYESFNKLSYENTTLIKNLWIISQQLNPADYWVDSIDIKPITNSPLTQKMYVTIYLNDGSQRWELGPLLFTFKNIQKPTQLGVTNANLFTSTPQDLVGNAFANPSSIKKNITFNVGNQSTGSNGENLQVIDYHNNVPVVREYYPKTISYPQPITSFSVSNYDNEEGTITFEVAFQTISASDYWTPFSIAYFDKYSNPIRFKSSNEQTKILKSFTISGFEKQLGRFAIFNGEDGKTLYYTLIGFGVVLFLSILYTIIHIIRRKNRTIAAARPVRQ